MSDLKKKNRLPSHLVQSQSPSPARAPKSSKSSWWEILVGRRPSKLDVEVPEVQVQIQPNLTRTFFGNMENQRHANAIKRNHKGEILDPTTGEVPDSSAYYDELSRMHIRKYRKQEEDQLYADEVAAHNKWMDTHPNWKADEEYNAKRLEYEDNEALTAAHAASSWRHLTPKRWLQRKKYRLPNMTVPGDVGKSNSAVDNLRLFGLFRNDPPGANRMGGKSKRSNKSKCRSNKGKKTHRFRSRSTRRRQH